MRIAFLGTASAVPTADNGYTSFLIEAGGRSILIDASGNTVQSILKAGGDPRELDILVLTHAHADHIGGYPSLVQTSDCMGRKKSLRVLCDPHTRQKAVGLTCLLDMEGPRTRFAIEYLESIQEPGCSIRLLPGNHAIPTCMVLLEEKGRRVLYTSDTGHSPVVARAASGCAVLIHEATTAHSTIAELEKDGHSSAYQAGLSAAAAKVERLFLCHLYSERYPDSAAPLHEARKAYKGEVILPELFVWYPL